MLVRKWLCDNPFSCIHSFFRRFVRSYYKVIDKKLDAAADVHCGFSSRSVCDG